MRQRAFTLFEVLVTVLVSLVLIVIVAGIVLPMFGGSRHSPQLKDSLQLNMIHKAMVVWANNNKDCYPLPSLVDTMNQTVPEQGRVKDTTANIYSMLVFTGSLSTEILISPLEKNRNVKACEDYEFESPRGAVDPTRALWDPQFSAALDGRIEGNTSYAHLQPSGLREKRYSFTFDAGEMILADRGPEIASVQKDAQGSVLPTLANPRSNALRFYSRGTSWSGNVAYNDNHVDFLRDWIVPGKPYPKSRGRTYGAADGKQWPDVWCYDEPDDPKSVNDYLGIFIKAGETPADFRAVWD
jgi:hypothetical protein